MKPFLALIALSILTGCEGFNKANWDVTCSDGFSVESAYSAYFDGQVIHYRKPEWRYPKLRLVPNSVTCDISRTNP